MKKEEREQIIVAAAKKCLKYDDVTLTPDAKVLTSPETYWVQIWIKVPLIAVKGPAKP